MCAVLVKIVTQSNGTRGSVCAMPVYYVRTHNVIYVSQLSMENVCLGIMAIVEETKQSFRTSTPSD